MTLGKIERFWQTILAEFFAKARFVSLEDAQTRLQKWVQYYNFRRPHQGIGGLCPADRYFEIAHELRKTIEKGIEENVQELALRDRGGLGGDPSGGPSVGPSGGPSVGQIFFCRFSYCIQPRYAHRFDTARIGMLD